MLAIRTLASSSDAQPYWGCSNIKSGIGVNRQSFVTLLVGCKRHALAIQHVLRWPCHVLLALALACNYLEYACSTERGTHLVRVAREEAVLVKQVVDHTGKHLLLVGVVAGLEGLQKLHHLHAAAHRRHVMFTAEAWKHEGMMSREDGARGLYMEHNR